MKIRSILKFPLLLFFFSFFLSDTEGQVYDRRGQTIYAEFGGSAFVYSINYESRFAAKTGGFGGRIGISYVGDWVAIPLQLNLLIGKKDSNKFFEIGGGICYFKYREPFEVGDRSFDQQTMGALSFMYRRHPRYGKFMWKVGITPLIGYWQDDDDGKAVLGVLPMFGLAFGKAF